MPASPSANPWRPLIYRTRRGQCVKSHTNELAYEPGVIATESQPCLRDHNHAPDRARPLAHPLRDENGTHGAAAPGYYPKRRTKAPHLPNGTARPRWSAELFCYTCNVCRGVLRLFERPFQTGFVRALSRPATTY